MADQSSATETFPVGGDELGQMIREKDWSKTTIGALDHWQQSFKTTLNILLSSEYPKFL